MTAERERPPKGDRRGRKGLTATTAALLLGVVVVAVGAVGFVVMTAVSHTTSSSQHSCSPASSPQCTAKSHATTEARSLAGLPARAGG